MANQGFQVHKRLASGADPIETVKSVASTQYELGDLLSIFIAVGDGTKVAATSKATHLYQSMITPDDVIVMSPQNKSTADCEPMLCTPVYGVVLKSWLVGDSVPKINKVAANSNAVATTVLATTATTDNDYDNGTIFCPELGEQRLITDSQDTAGVCTFTVSPAFSRPVTVGDTIIAVPFSKGSNAVQFDATTPQRGLSTDPANKTGGQNQIFDVVLKGDNIGPYVLSICPDRE